MTQPKQHGDRARRRRGVCRISCGLLLAVLSAACGYRPLIASFPEGDGAVVIPPVGNTTSTNQLVGPFTRALRGRAASAGISVKGKGAPRLVAAIVRVETGPGQLIRDGKNLVPLDKIQTIEVVAHIEAEDGRVIVPEERFVHGGRSLAGNDVQTEVALEAERRLGIVDEIAEMIVSYMFLSRR